MKVMQMKAGATLHILKAGDVVPALPDLNSLFRPVEIKNLAGLLKAIPLELFNTSMVVQRQVLRFPLKPQPSNSTEAKHLRSSADGLRYQCYSSFFSVR